MRQTHTPIFLDQHAHGLTNGRKCICYLNNAVQDGKMGKWKLRRAETSKNTCAAPCATLNRVYDRAPSI